jgi:hypothetical protein
MLFNLATPIIFLLRVQFVKLIMHFVPYHSYCSLHMTDITRERLMMRHLLRLSCSAFSLWNRRCAVFELPCLLQFLAYLGGGREYYYRSAWYLLHPSLLLGLFFDPENGGDMSLRNACWHSMDYTCVISQKTELFTTTAVRTSNPITDNIYCTICQHNTISRDGASKTTCFDIYVPSSGPVCSYS